MNPVAGASFAFGIASMATLLVGLVGFFVQIGLLGMNCATDAQPPRSMGSLSGPGGCFLVDVFAMLVPTSPGLDGAAIAVPIMGAGVWVGLALAFQSGPKKR